MAGARDFEGLRTLINTDASSSAARREILLEGVTMQRADNVLQFNRSTDRVTVRSSRFSGVRQFFEDDDEFNIIAVDVEGSRFEQMTTAINLSASSNSSRSVRIRGNVFEGVDRAIRVAVFTTSTVIDAPENHFIGVTTSLLQDGRTAGEVVDADLSGSYFADAADQPLGLVAIEASIDDTQIDRGADFKGRTRYAPVARRRSSPSRRQVRCRRWPLPGADGRRARSSNASGAPSGAPFTFSTFCPWFGARSE